MKTHNKFFPCQYQHNALRFAENPPKTNASIFSSRFVLPFAFSALLRL